MHIAKRYERKRNHKDKTITPNPPSKEAFSEELETDLLGLIGDMETVGPANLLPLGLCLSA